MEQFISIIIFSLPGLLTYIWIQMFGVNPSIKHNSTEMIGISALLWIPTTLMTVVAYNVLFFIFDIIFSAIKVDLSALKLTYLLNVYDLINSSTNFIFLVFFLALSVVFSTIVALLWVLYIYNHILKFINKVRLYRNISELSKNSLIWDSFFLEIEEGYEKIKEENGKPLVVEVYKLGNAENKIIGSVKKASRPYETERAIVLDDPDGWKESSEYYTFPVKQSYVDLKSGLVVNEIDHEKEKEKSTP